jgi:hypothetical protein
MLAVLNLGDRLYSRFFQGADLRNPKPGLVSRVLVSRVLCGRIRLRCVGRALDWGKQAHKVGEQEIGVHQRLPILVTGPEVFNDLIDRCGDFRRAVDCAVAHLAARSGFRLPQLRSRGEARTKDHRGRRFGKFYVWGTLSGLLFDLVSAFFCLLSRLIDALLHGLLRGASRLLRG